MNKHKVFFAPLKDGEGIQKINTAFRTLINQIKPFGFIEKNSSVAVKLHFGEEGNAGYVNPVFVATVVDFLKKKTSSIFLTDTNALYKGRRTNAVDHLALAYEHGFTPEKVGVPVIIADGLFGDDYREVKVKDSTIKTAFVASAVHRADALIGVAHFKGHIMTGFGGALKNLGMGCAARRGKLVQHGGVSPVVRTQTCISCGRCVVICPVTAITLVNTKAKIDPKVCIGCASCIAVCPIAAIEIAWEKGGDTIQPRMIEYAAAAVSNKKEKCFYFNFAIKITKECDCLAKDDPKICPDIGIFASSDPVAIDQACFDKVLEVAGRDVLTEAHPERDGEKQLEYAEKLGLGSRDYELIEVK